MRRRAAIALTSGLAAALAVVPAAAGAGSLVTGVGTGGVPQVGVFDSATAAPLYSFYAYSPSFSGGVRVAAGDVTGDGVPDIVTGSGLGSSHVKVFDGVNGVLVRSFLAFGSFTGGVFVAAGDVTGDGKADVIVGADAGGGPHVKVFDAVTNAEVQSFFAYGAGFSGGVRVAAGDVNGDGRADIITGAGEAGSSHVKVFDAVTGLELHSFLAFPGFSGGVFVAAGDVNGDGATDLVVGADATGASHVKAFDLATVTAFRSFLAYGPSFSGGVRVAAGDLNGDGHAEIVTGAGPGGGPHVKVFDGLTGSEGLSFFSTSPVFTGGIYVAAAPAFDPSDTEAPVLTVPTSIELEATGPDGAVVTFTATALDVVDGAVPVTCRPESGSTFPIGDTTVTCSATDAAGNTSTASFVVHVTGGTEQLGDVDDLITGFGLDRSLSAMLENKTAAAEAALAAGTGECDALDDLLRAVISKAGTNGLSFTEAQQLLDAVNQIETVEGCIPVGSALPAVQRALVELMQTIESLGLPTGETSVLHERARKAGFAAVDGAPCPALGDLAEKIASDMGKPGKLTAAQGAVLSAEVAAIAALAKCV